MCDVGQLTLGDEPADERSQQALEHEAKLEIAREKRLKKLIHREAKNILFTKVQ